jgi:hypothetical protein
MRYNEIIERLEELNPSALFADGFSQALIAHTSKSPYLAVYDSEKCIAILIESGMSTTDAVEYFEYNVLGSYVGENGPIFVSL